MAPDTLEFKVACFFERNILKKTALQKPWRNFLRSWGLSPCRWGNPLRIMTHSLFADVSDFYLLVLRGYHNASQPVGGRAGRRGIMYLERGFPR